MENGNVNSVLQSLRELVGTWEMNLSNASFLPDPTTTISGTASFEWFEGGDFLIMRQGSKVNGVPWSTWFVGRDQDSQNYSILYIDDRRVSRVYEMSFDSSEWKIWRNSHGFSQRFTGAIDKDMKVIKASWEKSYDGKTWEHDFDITYIREDKSFA